MLQLLARTIETLNRMAFPRRPSVQPSLEASTKVLLPAQYAPCTSLSIDKRSRASSRLSLVMPTSDLLDYSPRSIIQTASILKPSSVPCILPALILWQQGPSSDQATGSVLRPLVTITTGPRTITACRADLPSRSISAHDPAKPTSTGPDHWPLVWQPLVRPIGSTTRRSVAPAAQRRPPTMPSSPSSMSSRWMHSPKSQDMPTGQSE